MLKKLILLITTILVKVAKSAEEVKRASIAQLYGLEKDVLVIDNNLIDERTTQGGMISDARTLDHQISVLSTNKVMSSLDINGQFSNFKRAKLIEHDLIALMTDYKKITLYRISPNQFNLTKIKEIVFDFEGDEEYEMVDAVADYASGLLQALFQKKSTGDLMLSCLKLYKLELKPKNFKISFEMGSRVAGSMAEFRLFKPSIRRLIKNEEEGGIAESRFFSFVYLKDPYGLNKSPKEVKIFEVRDWEKSIVEVSTLALGQNDLLREIYQKSDILTLGFVISKEGDSARTLYQQECTYNQKAQSWVLRSKESLLFKNDTGVIENYGVFATEVESTRRIAETGELLKGVFIHQIAKTGTGRSLVTYIPSIPKSSSELSNATYSAIQIFDEENINSDLFYSLDGTVLRKKPSQVKLIGVKMRQDTTLPYLSYTNFRPIKTTQAFQIMTRVAIYEISQAKINSYNSQISLTILEMDKISVFPVKEEIMIKTATSPNYTQYQLNWPKKMSDLRAPIIINFWIEIEPQGYHHEKNFFYELDRGIAHNIEKIELVDNESGMEFKKIKLENGNLSDLGDYDFWSLQPIVGIAFACNDNRNLDGFTSCDYFSMDFDFDDETLNLKILYKNLGKLKAVSEVNSLKTKFDFYCIFKYDNKSHGGQDHLDQELGSSGAHGTSPLTLNRSVYCHYLALFENKTAQVGNFVLENNVNLTEHVIGSRFFNSVEDIDFVKFPLNRTNDFLTGIGSEEKGREYNLETGFAIVQNYYFQDFYNLDNKDDHFRDAKSNFCPYKIIGRTEYRQGATRNVTQYTVLSKCKGQCSLNVYSGNVRLRLPVNLQEESMFCGFMDYFVYYDLEEKRVRIGTLDSDQFHLAKSYIPVEMFEFESVEKLICSSEKLVVVGNRQNPDGKGKISTAVVFNMKVLVQDTSFGISAGESLIEKSRMVLDVVDMDGVYQEFELVDVDINYKKLSKYSQDYRRAYLLKCKSGKKRSLFLLTKNVNSYEFVYNSPVKEESEFKVELTATVNYKYQIGVTVLSLRSTKGTFNITKKKPIHLTDKLESEYLIKDLLDIEGMDTVTTFHLISKQSPIQVGDYSIISNLEQPFQTLLERNLFDNILFQLTLFGYGIQVYGIERSNPQHLRNSAEDFYIVKVKIFDFSNLSDPRIYTSDVIVEVGNFGAFGGDFKIDVKDFFLDAGRMLNLICLDFRRLGKAKFGLGKGDFNVKDYIRIKTQTPDSGHHDDHHRILLQSNENTILNNEPQQPSILDNAEISYSVGMIIDRGHGIVSQGHYGTDMRIFNSVIYREDEGRISSSNIVNSQIRPYDNSVKSTGFSNVTLGLSLPSLSHDTIKSYQFYERFVFSTSQFFKCFNKVHVVFIEKNDTDALKIGEFVKENGFIQLKNIKKIEFEEQFLFHNLTCNQIILEENNPNQTYIGHCVVTHYGRSHIYFRIPKYKDSETTVKVTTKFITYPVRRIEAIQEPNSILTDSYLVTFRRDQNQLTRGYVSTVVWFLRGNETKVVRAVKNYRFSLDSMTFVNNVYSGVFEDHQRNLYLQRNNKVYKLEDPSRPRNSSERPNPNEGLKISSLKNPIPSINQTLVISNGRKTVEIEMNDLLIPIYPDESKYKVIYNIIRFTIYGLFGVITFFGFINCIVEWRKMKKLEKGGSLRKTQENDYSNVDSSEHMLSHDMRDYDDEE